MKQYEKTTSHLPQPSSMDLRIRPIHYTGSIASSGDHFTGTNAQLSWTIGETMIETFGNGSNQLTQGFHQTNLMVTAVEDLSESFQVSVFPNPATDVLNIEWSEISDPLTLTLYDATGKLLLRQKALDKTMTKTLDLTGLFRWQLFAPP